MEKVNIRDYDATEFLDNEEIIAGYLLEVFKTGTDVEIKTALADVARIHNMTTKEICKKYNVELKNKNDLPKIEDPKVSISIRIPRSYVAGLRATGRGWQTRAGEYLVNGINRGDLGKK